MIPMLLSLWMLAAVQSTAPPSQNPNQSFQDVYAPVPEADRPEFRAALEALVALEKSGDWGKIYDRFYLNDSGQTRKQFVKRHHLQVAVFIPKQIYYISGDETWIVSGCAVYSPPMPLQGKRRGGMVSDFAAKHTSSGWRFEAPPGVSISKDSSGGVHFCNVGTGHESAPE